jgi:alkylation response protein AidB-like acyl-CoA dehydrogenase
MSPTWEAEMSAVEVKTMSDDELRADVRAWLDTHWVKPARGERVALPESSWERSESLEAWLKEVVEARWATPTWPVQWYGRGLDKDQAKIIAQEFARVKAPGANLDRTHLAGNTFLTFATDEVKTKLLLPVLTGEVRTCLLYSEPGAGSDLAGVRTRAERQGDKFIINGQKVWTSGAMTADYGFLVCRTDWDVPKHQGISFLLCPMKQPGIEVRPLHQITGESHFNEVFITDAEVPVENLFSQLNGGWKVLQTALAYERSMMGEGAGGRKAPKGSDFIALARESGCLDDPLIRQDIARVTALRKLNDLSMARAKADMAQGTSSPIMSIGKLAMSKILHEEARLMTSIIGAESLYDGGAHPLAQDTNYRTFNAYMTSIGGGTDQIQRNIIGERVLGLPKEVELDRDVPFRTVKAG